MTTRPSTHAISQYATTTGNLTARIALHAYGTNPQNWFSWLGERLPLAGEVLEVGAGTGKLWTHIDHVARGLRVTLTDFSAAMCEQLMNTVPGAAVLRCDAIGLPFGDASFDTVIANHMLYHLDDPDVGLREFSRVLRPGGRIAVATNGSEHLAEVDAVGRVIGRPDLAVTASMNFAAENGPEYVARHFTEVTVERYLCDLDIPTVEPILAYLASMADEPLTPEQRAAASEYIRARIDTHGSYRVRKHTVLITAFR